MVVLIRTGFSGKDWLKRFCLKEQKIYDSAKKTALGPLDLMNTAFYRSWSSADEKYFFRRQDGDSFLFVAEKQKPGEHKYQEFWVTSEGVLKNYDENKGWQRLLLETKEEQKQLKQQYKDDMKKVSKKQLPLIVENQNEALAEKLDKLTETFNAYEKNLAVNTKLLSLLLEQNNNKPNRDIKELKELNGRFAVKTLAQPEKR